MSGSDTSYPTVNQVIEKINHVFCKYGVWLESDFGPNTPEQFVMGFTELKNVLCMEIEGLYDTSPTTVKEEVAE